MKTTEIDGKQYAASTQDDGSIILIPIQEEVEEEQGGHRCGDVHKGFAFGVYVYIGRGESLFLDSGEGELTKLAGHKDEVLLNVFDVAAGEYVKKSDVVEALSTEDYAGDSVLSGLANVGECAIEDTRKSLAKLGITAEQ